MGSSQSISVETVVSGQTFGADEALMKQVQSKIRLEGRTEDGQYTIVFCPINSRVGSDVEAALTRVPVSKRIILILMHHTRDVDYSTAGISWSEMHPNVDLDVHVLFHESVPGLLSCSKNIEAVDQIQTYLKQYRKKLIHRHLKRICLCGCCLSTSGTNNQLLSD